MKRSLKTNHKNERKSRRLDNKETSGLLERDTRLTETNMTTFIRNFRSKYGRNSPDFIVTDFENVAEKCNNETKLLGIYLHYAGALQADDYCRNVICSNDLKVIFSKMIMCGWDVTDCENKQRFLMKCSMFLSNDSFSYLKRCKAEKYPLLVVLECTGRRCDIKMIFTSLHNVKIVKKQLGHEVSLIEQEQKIKKQLQREQEIRRRIIREQDEAYMKSLEADRKKSQSKKLQPSNSLNHEKPSTSRNVLQKIKTAFLPKEPTYKRSKVTRIRFITPEGGAKITRNFNISDKLGLLLTFVAAQGYSPQHYDVISAWPTRQIISNLDQNKALCRYKLFPQVTLIVEKKH